MKIVFSFQRVEFPKGMTIILIPLSSDKDCMTSREWRDAQKLPKPTINPMREKLMTIRIRATIQYDLPWMFGIQIIGIFIPCLLLTLIVFCVCDRRLK